MSWHDRSEGPRTVAELDDALSEPPPGVIECLGRLPGDILVLGVGGKMGPTLARMARRASDAAGVRRRVVGVSRFSTPGLPEQLAAWGVETLACDLLDEQAVAALPRLENVVFMAGYKFGAQADPARTWAMNCYLPALIGNHFRHSRIAAFSTGNVYGLVPASGGGSREDDPPRPVGEYAQTTLGRERMLEYFSQRHEFPLAVLRLNYACELRYGVLVDLAWKVWRNELIDLSMSHVNVIWQGDANAVALQALEQASQPPLVLNIAGPERLRIREVCEQFGRLLDRQPRWAGSEQPDALLSDSGRCRQLFGAPRVPAERLMGWIADWVARGGPSLGKPTHFESRDGRF